MRLSSFLYRAARTMNTAEAISRGPKATGRRAKNIALGRLLGRLGVWRRLWR